MAIVSESFRAWFLAIRNNKFFEWGVIGVILLSAVVIGAKTYEIDPTLGAALHILDVAITLFFLMEILIRMASEESLRKFFKGFWNIFDFLIVSVSLIPIDESELALLGRLLRIFRVLRLISVIPELRVLINALAIAIPRMGYVVLLMFIIFYIYAAVGSFLFEKINPVLWGDVAIAMLTLFRVATFEDWTDVMYETMDVYSLSWIFYLSFIFLTAFVFLNMMIGIVVDGLHEEHQRHNRETGNDPLEHVKAKEDEILERLARIERALENR